MKPFACFAFLLLLFQGSGVLEARQSTVYVSVVSTKLFVVGAPNPQTGLFYQKTSDDTLWQHTGRNNIRAFGVDVHTPSQGKVLCIASGNGVHQSVDGGKTWKITTGWRITEVLSVAIDPRTAKIMYCSTPYGVYKTTDAGTTWNERTNGMGTVFVQTVLIDKKNPETVYCATEMGVYRSEDGAATWKKTGLHVGGVRSLAQHPVNSNVLFVGTDDFGIYATNNSGRYWEKMAAGLDHVAFYTIVFDPTNPEIMYAGGYITGVYKSADGGKSWRRVNDGLTNLNVHSIVVDPANGNRVYAGTMFGGVFKSENGGTTWRYAGLGGSQVWTMTIQPF